MRHWIWMRWLAVLPGALLGGLLATIPLRLVLYSTLRSFVEPYPELPERLLTPLVIATCFVWSGARIAPSRKLYTAVILFGLWMVILGATVAFTLFVGEFRGRQVTFQLGGLSAAMAFAGGVIGVLIVQNQTTRGDGRAAPGA